MPVAIVTTDFPEGVGPDTYDSVKLDLSSDPAAGLIFHWASGIDPTLGPQPTITEHPVHDYVKAS